uniref:Uncharacterized protein n=1 Tax=Avena sativa TaxID=4498 RepID=A0ACD5ZMV4_AVESA
MDAAIGAASRLIGSVLNHLSNEFVEAYVASSQLGLNTNKIKGDMTFTQGLLHEAHRRGVNDNPGLPSLVQQLNAKADEAEDALDELHYFIIQDQLDGTQYAVPDLGTGLRGHCRHIHRAVRHTTGNWLTCYPRLHMQVDKLSFNSVAMSMKIKSVMDEMLTLCHHVSILLRYIPHNSSTATFTLKRPLTGSTIVQDTLYGRRAIFERTVDDLTSDSNHGGTLFVLPIVGPGGIGKTTFTQHLYNDKRIEQHFTVRIWVCVSNDFDVLKLSQQILSCIHATGNEGSNTTNETTNIDQLQISIAQRLKSKRFLIVFDDIWECNSEGWKNLLAPLMKGEAKGNMILVTTRFPSKAEIVKTTNPIALHGLDPSEFFTLFEAFIFDGNKPEGYEDDLADVARDIASKLKGSPLAAKTVGRLLKKELSREHWMGVLESNEWRKQKNDDDIMPSLRISYDYLPFRLKKCFSYFSLFPEDYKFNNLEVTYFWIALGIIQKDENYMEELVNNGFLMKEDDYLKGQCYVMHDLLHELSRYVSSHECLNIYSSLSFRADDIPKSVRHLSITMEDRYEETFREEITKLRGKIDFRNLRALMIFREYEERIDDILKDTFKETEGLRVLFIVVKSSDCFPPRFSKLIHLRYLKITSAGVRSEMTLPSILSRFFHLKLLDLSGWCGRNEFPKDISRLVSLRHLFAENKLHSNVPEVGKIKCLQELKEFHVKKESAGFELRELGGLAELGGELSIYNLEKVATKEEAMEAKLVAKRNLKELRLIWATNHATESDVLDGLEPHRNLQALDIRNHGGTAGPPSWLCGDISIIMLKSLHLEGVSWVTLPPFGLLPHLTSLTLRKICGLREIRPCFSGVTDKSFMYLKQIVLDALPAFIEWVRIPNGHSFSRLEDIRCRKCPNLLVLPFLESSGSYTRLLTLAISDCPKLSMPPMPHVSTLLSFSVGRSFMPELFYSLKNLHVDRYKGELALHNLDKAETVSISGVSHISLTELNKSLIRLDVRECNITCHGIQDLMCLQSLRVDKCGNFFQCPMGESVPFHVSLRELHIEGESSMHSMALLSNITSLTHLILRDCENLTVDGFNPLITFNLKELVVYNCKSNSIAADLLSKVARTELLPAAGSFQLDLLHVDSISAVLVAPIGSLLATTLHTLQFSFDRQMESFTEEQAGALGLLTSLQTLEFQHCYSLQTLPQGLHRLLSLRKILLGHCTKLRSLPKDGFPPLLEEFSLVSCNAELNEQARELKVSYPGLRVHTQG